MTIDGERFKCPDLSNPADYFMSIMSKESMEYQDSDDKEVLAKSLAIRDEKYTDRIKHFSSHYA
jgi:hypothetical protein